MRQVQIAEDLRVTDCGTGPIEVTHLQALTNMGYSFQRGTITEIFHKEDGAVDDSPSFAFSIGIAKTGFVLTELSLKMLNDCLDVFGYTIEKKKKKVAHI